MLLLLFLFAGASAAEHHPLLQRSAAEGAAAFARGMDDAGALSRTLGATDPQHVDRWSRVLKEEVAAAAEAALSRVLGKVEGDAAAAEEAAQQLRRQVEELRIGESGVSRVRATAKAALRTLLGRLGQGRRNLDDCMDHAARLRFSDVEQLLRREVSSSPGVRECLASFPESHPQLSGELRGGSFPLEGEGAAQEWTRAAWRGGVDALRSEFGAIKGAAMELISRSKDAAGGDCRAALDTLRPFEGALGPQWDRLHRATREAVGHF